MRDEDSGWKWWVGYDDERFHTECETREEAVYIAREEQDGGWIVEAKKANNLLLSGYFDARDFVDMADEQAQADLGDFEDCSEVFEVNDAATDALESAVREAIDKWQEAHGLRFTVWRFSDQRNLEYIPAEDDETEQDQTANGQHSMNRYLNTST